MNKVTKTILSIIGFIVLLLLLWYLRSLVIYIVISLILTLIGRPLVNKINAIKIGKIQIPNAVSALLAMLIIILIFAGILSTFIPVVIEQTKVISSIEIDKVAQSVSGPLKDVQNWMNKYNLSTDSSHDSNIIKSELGKILNFANLTGIFNSFVGTLGNIFIAIFSIAFITFFFLKDRELVYNVIITITPDKYEEQVKHIIMNAKRLLTRYFIGILIQISLITFFNTIGLTIVGAKYPLAIGFFAGLINVIPYIGPLIGTTFGLLIGLISNLNADFYSQLLPLLLLMLMVFVIVQLMDNLIFQPLIFSNSVKAHPLEIFLVIISAGTLAGVPGMILAVPAYTFFRIIAKEFFQEFSVIKSLTKGI